MIDETLRKCRKVRGKRLQSGVEGFSKCLASIWCWRLGGVLYNLNWHWAWQSNVLYGLQTFHGLWKTYERLKVFEANLSPAFHFRLLLNTICRFLAVFKGHVLPSQAPHFQQCDLEQPHTAVGARRCPGVDVHPAAMFWFGLDKCQVPPKPLYHSPSSAGQGRGNMIKGSWVEIRTGRDHPPVTVTDKTDWTWGEKGV